MAAAEFSRTVALSKIGRDLVTHRIEATEAERASLARRFGLLALDRLVAEVGLRRDGTAIRLEALFEAAFTQECVVSLDPVSGSLAERFALVYGPPETEPADPDPLADAAAFEPLIGDGIDIGEAVAQELSLALPLAPRLPEAVVEEPAEAPDARPFAALRRLVPP